MTIWSLCRGGSLRRVVGGLVGAFDIFFFAGILISERIADRGLFDGCFGVCGCVGSSIVILKCVRYNWIPCVV